MTIDHIGFNVTDFAVSKAFYAAALRPLDIEIVAEGEGWAMVRGEGTGGFWFGSFGPPPGPIHLAFAAATRAQVDDFHQAAIAAGGRDNGPPGIRAQYSPDYYGAFVIDPNGHNLEAVCRKPA